jgi:hypothetical protein
MNGDAEHVIALTGDGPNVVVARLIGAQLPPQIGDLLGEVVWIDVRTDVMPDFGEERLSGDRVSPAAYDGVKRIELPIGEGNHLTVAPELAEIGQHAKRPELVELPYHLCLSYFHKKFIRIH